MRKTVLIVALLAVLVVFPFFMGEFYINLASQILIAAVFAMSLNLLVGYGGLSSLGHASFLGFAAYACAWSITRLGFDPFAAGALALVATLLLAAFFGVIALRATGLGFMMITLALSQVLWGLAYRWAAVTNGDNGMSIPSRPRLFGLLLDDAASFYWFALGVTLIAFVCIAVFIGSAFGASLQGTRDQPRRMAALGHDVWMVRWLTFIYAGFWGGVSGLLYIYYNKYIHPTSLAITSSAEGLLSVIAGGAGTMAGPVVGAVLVVILKNYVSSYIERWNMLLGIVFLLIVLFVPEGIVPGSRRIFLRLRGASKG
jgi:branched-chain amino acid transport system permease protein